MGKAARNHGGTGGHGYFPLPGEKRNYNRHILTDANLFGLVKNIQRKPVKTDKLNVISEMKVTNAKLIHTDKVGNDTCTHMLQTNVIQKKNNQSTVKKNKVNMPTQNSPKTGTKFSNSSKQIPISSVHQHSDLKKLENPQSTSATISEHKRVEEDKQDFPNGGKRSLLISGVDPISHSTLTSTREVDQKSLKTPIKLKKKLEVFFICFLYFCIIFSRNRMPTKILVFVYPVN